MLKSLARLRDGCPACIVAVNLCIGLESSYIFPFITPLSEPDQPDVFSNVQRSTICWRWMLLRRTNRMSFGSHISAEKWGVLRLSTDKRKRSAVTDCHKLSLPRMNRFVDSLVCCELIAILNRNSGSQVEVSQSSWRKTLIILHLRSIQCARMAARFQNA